MEYNEKEMIEATLDGLLNLATLIETEADKVLAKTRVLSTAMQGLLKKLEDIADGES